MSRPVVARIHLASLRHNYRTLARLAGSSQIMAVVKADAYGHGLEPVARTLAAEGCAEFGVTDAEEGIRLRGILGASATITLLSGIFDAEDARACREHRLVPAVYEPEQIRWLKRAGFAGPVWLKLDTGMNRLGALEPERLRDELRQNGIAIRGVLSHLACADTPEHPLNAAQIRRFLSLAEALDRSPNEKMLRSLANSAGLIALPEARLDLARPGLALYGCEPVANRPAGLRPVMRLAARVLQVRALATGESVSYGASFTATRPMRVATLAAGYADGVPRGLSNHGAVFLGGRECPIVGRVCMDYTIVDVTGLSVRVGDEAEFWGARMPLARVAALLDTIPYTLLTGVTARVPRQVVDD